MTDDYEMHLSAPLAPEHPFWDEVATFAMVKVKEYGQDVVIIAGYPEGSIAEATLAPGIL